MWDDIDPETKTIAISAVVIIFVAICIPFGVHWILPQLVPFPAALGCLVLVIGLVALFMWN